jgi:hypothetical protein
LGFGGGRHGCIAPQKIKSAGYLALTALFSLESGPPGVFGLVMTVAFVDSKIYPKKLDYQNLLVIEVSKFLIKSMKYIYML